MPRGKKRNVEPPNSSQKSGSADIARPLERIARMLAAIAIKDSSSQQDQVAILDRAGYTPGEIGEILGVSGPHISSVIHRLKGAKKRPKAKAPKE